MSPRTLTPGAVVALAALGLAACGGSPDPSGGPAASAASAATATPAKAAEAHRPSVAALSLSQVTAIPLGAPRASVLDGIGASLDAADYALTARERHSCAFYANAGASGAVSYDTVWRFCFQGDKLVSVGTAPLRKNAGPDAGKVAKHPGKALVRPKKQ